MITFRDAASPSPILPVEITLPLPISLKSNYIRNRCRAIHLSPTTGGWLLLWLTLGPTMTSGAQIPFLQSRGPNGVSQLEFTASKVSPSSRSGPQNTFTATLSEEKGTPRTKGSDSSTAGTVGAAAAVAGAGQGARPGTTTRGDNGGRRGVGETRGGSRRAGPSRRPKARHSPGRARPEAGGPGRRPSQGHVARA